MDRKKKAIGSKNVVFLGWIGVLRIGGCENVIGSTSPMKCPITVEFRRAHLSRKSFSILDMAQGESVGTCSPLQSHEHHVRDQTEEKKSVRQ
jgi:hypothetical protein